ncbi:MAG: DUF86 domain-containing protein [Parvibaculum sp.]|uniref:HepT-like ribonuclease domain-containing protein n=1 Tax=Parvibaculum sp. TaxID=2024848 RepID=UPI0032EFEEB1
MSSSDPMKRIADILEQVARIESHLAGQDLETFRVNTLAQDAVERCLERICEAARKIGDMLDERYPKVDFPNLRRFGSILRHDYGDVDVEIIWQVTVARLPLLKAACRAELGL